METCELSDRAIDNIFHLMQEGAYEFTHQGDTFTIHYISEQNYSMLGYTPLDTLDTYDSFMEIVHPDDRQGVSDFLHDDIIHKKACEHLYRAKTRDGAYRWIQTQVKCIDYDQETESRRFVGINTDITRIKENEEKYCSIFEDAGSSIVLLGTDLTIKDINHEAEQLFCCSRNEIRGKQITDNQILDDHKGFAIQQLKKIITYDASISNIQIDVINKEGKRRNVIWTGIPQYDIERHLTGIIISGQDMTVQYQTDQQIREQNRQLKHLNDLKTRMLSITSHELRTPMTAISGHLQLIEQGMLGPLTSEQKDSLDVVIRNTDRLNRLIQDILDVSRLENSSMKFILEYTDADQIIHQAVDTMRAQAQEHHVQICADIQETTSQIYCDSERIMQVFVNLLNNAIKYSKPESKIHLSATESSEHIRFDIKDHGPGIPKEEQQNIFRPFYQVECKRDNQTFHGAGLGLAITRGIVLAHGGTIWVESEGDDQGSTFSFTLPFTPDHDVEDTFKKLDLFTICDTQQDEAEQQ